MILVQTMLLVKEWSPVKLRQEAYRQMKMGRSWYRPIEVNWS